MLKDRATAIDRAETGFKQTLLAELNDMEAEEDAPEEEAGDMSPITDVSRSASEMVATGRQLFDSAGWEDYDDDGDEDYESDESSDFLEIKPGGRAISELI